MVGHEAQEIGEFRCNAFNIADEFRGADQDESEAQQWGREPAGVDDSPDQEQAQRDQYQDAQQNIDAEIIEAHSASFCGTASCG